MLGIFKKKSKNKTDTVVSQKKLVKKKLKENREKEKSSKNLKKLRNSKEVPSSKKILAKKESFPVKKEINTVKPVDSKSSILGGMPINYLPERIINRLQKRLDKITQLGNPQDIYFEKLYKVAYVISYSKKAPEWLKYYDLLFLGESHAIIISRFNTSAGPLITIKEIMNSSLKLESLTTLYFKLEFLINQMIKMYNEGKNFNYHFKDSVREMKTLGLINDSLYDRLLFLGDIRTKIGRAWSVGEITFDSISGKKDQLKNKEIEFKTLLSEVYVDLVNIYMKIQEPYLKKFYLLWDKKKLNIGSPNSFYRI